MQFQVKSSHLFETVHYDNNWNEIEYNTIIHKTVYIKCNHWIPYYILTSTKPINNGITYCSTNSTNKYITVFEQCHQQIHYCVRPMPPTNTLLCSINATNKYITVFDQCHQQIHYCVRTMPPTNTLLCSINATNKYITVFDQWHQLIHYCVRSMPPTNTLRCSTNATGGRRSPVVACWASDHWVASSNPLRGKFRHQFRLIIPGVCLAQFSLNNVHKRGLKHHHFISTNATNNNITHSSTNDTSNNITHSSTNDTANLCVSVVSE